MIRSRRQLPTLDARARLRAAVTSVQIAWRRTGARLRRMLAALIAPSTIILALLVSGFCCAVAGVAMLAGDAWALITAAVLLFAAALLMLRGAANG